MATVVVVVVVASNNIFAESVQITVTEWTQPPEVKWFKSLPFWHFKGGWVHSITVYLILP